MSYKNELKDAWSDYFKKNGLDLDGHFHVLGWKARVIIEDAESFHKICSVMAIDELRLNEDNNRLWYRSPEKPDSVKGSRWNIKLSDTEEVGYFLHKYRTEYSIKK